MVMIMKKLIVLIMTFSLIVAMPITSFAEDEAQPEQEGIRAKSVLLMCMDTGEVLYKQNELEHLSPASVTKIMTILLILEAIDEGKIKLDDTVTASEEAVSMGGSQIWLEVGEQMSVEELLKAVVVASANDACTALAEYVGGSSTGFVKMMNDRAAELGLENTNFENCNGLDDTVKNHYSCAYDLAVISKEVMKHELIKDYTCIWLDSLRGGKTELNNTNKLVNTYEGITGLKTGTTSNAGFCIAATAQRDNMNLVAVVLGSETSKDRFDTASYLLDWGFSEYEIFEPEIDDTQIGSVKIKLGEEKEITPVTEESAKIVIKRGTGDVEYKYSVKDEAAAPLKKGDKLGEIVIENENVTLGTIDLIADKDVNRVTLNSIFSNIIINI